MHLKKGYMIEAYVVGNIKFDKFDNRITRKYKGSKRPPHTWPEAWSLMTPKEKTKAILEHTRSVEQSLLAQATDSTLRSTRQASSASGSTSPAAAARVASKSSALQATLRSSAGTRKDEMCCRHIIEWCCSPDSLIGSERFNNTNTSCVTTRITEEIDGTSTEGLQYAKNKYNKMKVLPTVIFASMPCTGGTAWNSVNIRNEDGAEKIQQHIDLFDKLWANFTKLVEHCSSPTTTVVIEWPRNCMYWKLPKVRAFLESRDMSKVNFDGCFFGLTSKSTNMPIKKPWTFATDNPEVLTLFEGCKCPGHINHSQCEGKDTKITENYTIHLCIRLHKAISQSATRLFASRAGYKQTGSSACPAANPASAIPTMPCQQVNEQHRIKFEPSKFPFVSMVARPVGRKEIETNPTAKASVDAEWAKLRKRQTWDESKPREKQDVVREAKKDNRTIHFGHISRCA